MKTQSGELLFQDIVLDVDLYRREVVGRTCLTVRFDKPVDPAEGQGVHFNCDQLEIEHAFCGGVELAFRYVPTGPSKDGSAQDVREHFTLARERTLRPSLIVTPKAFIDCDEPVTFELHYRLANPTSAAFFVHEHAHAPWFTPHFFTNAASHHSMLWVPATRRGLSRAPMRVTVVAPSVVYRRREATEQPQSCLVLCSGELESKRLLPDSGKAEHVFLFTKGVTYDAIQLVVGALESAVAPSDRRLAAWCVATHQVKPMLTPSVSMYHSYPANVASSLGNILSCVQIAVDVLEHYLGMPLPYATFSCAFVSQFLRHDSTGPSLAVFSTSHLAGDHVLDAAFDSRFRVMKAVAAAWVGGLLCAKGPRDHWLIVGLRGFLAELAFKRLVGENESRYRMFRRRERILALDGESAPQLSSTDRNEPFSAELLDSDAFEDKAVFVMHMLELHVRRETFQKVIRLQLQRAVSDPTFRLSSDHLMRLFNSTGARIDQFNQQWVLGRAHPQIDCGAIIDRRKGRVSFAVEQKIRNGPASMTFSGLLSVRVSEPLAEYVHAKRIVESLHEFELPVHSKERRRRTKDVEEDRKDMIVKWFSIDPEMEWLARIVFRMPEFMWAEQLVNDADVLGQIQAAVALREPPTPSESTIEMIAEVLYNPQYFYGTRVAVAETLAATATSTNEWLGLRLLLAFYVRTYCEAPPEQAPPAVVEVPADQASTGVEARPQRAATGIQAQYIVKPNDFSQTANYFVQRAMVRALASVHNADLARTDLGRAVRRLLTSILLQNDNTMNFYADDEFVSDLLVGLASLPLLDDAEFDEIDHLIRARLENDRVARSFNCSVSLAGIRALCTLAENAPHRPQPLPLLFRMLNDDTEPTNVRVASAAALCQLTQHNPSVVLRILEIALNAHRCSPSPTLFVVSLLGALMPAPNRSLRPLASQHEPLSGDTDECLAAETRLCQLILHLRDDAALALADRLHVRLFGLASKRAAPANSLGKRAAQFDTPASFRVRTLVSTPMAPPSAPAT